MRSVLAFFLLLCVGVGAQTLEGGQVYSGPLKLTAPNLGASLMLPSGYRAQLASKQGPLIVQSDDDSHRMYLEANVSVIGNPVAMLLQKREYYGLRLFSPMQVKRMRPSLYYRLYDILDESRFTQALVYLVLGPQGRAIELIGFFENGGYEGMRQTMMTMADSISFTSLRVLPKQTSSLYLQLAGGHFVFYERHGSFSEKRELWLCRNADALLHGAYSTANRTSRSTASRRGSWELDEQTLTVKFGDGSFERYRVSKEANTLLFDGAQTFRLPSHACK